MSEHNGQAPEAPDPGEGPEQLEAGRYRLFVSPSGLVLARAVDTCERCQQCGCGTPVEPMPLPDPRRGRAHLIGWLTTNANRGIMGALAKGLSGGD